LLILGKKRKTISSKTHQLSFSIKPLTVLLTPPTNSFTGSAGIVKGAEAAEITGNSFERIPRAGEATGVDAGGHVAGDKPL